MIYYKISDVLFSKYEKNQILVWTLDFFTKFESEFEKNTLLLLGIFERLRRSR